MAGFHGDGGEGEAGGEGAVSVQWRGSSPAPPPEGGEERVEVECVHCGARMWIRRRAMRGRTGELLSEGAARARIPSWVCVGGHVVPGGVIVRMVEDGRPRRGGTGEGEVEK